MDALIVAEDREGFVQKTLLLETSIQNCRCDVVGGQAVTHSLADQDSPAGAHDPAINKLNHISLEIPQQTDQEAHSGGASRAHGDTRGEDPRHSENSEAAGVARDAGG